MTKGFNLMADNSKAEQRSLPFYRYVRAAYHEAGHVVMAHLLGRRFYHVTVFWEDESRGHVAIVPWQYDVPDDDGKIADMVLEKVDPEGRLLSVAVLERYSHPTPRAPRRRITSPVAEREILINHAGVAAGAIHSHSSYFAGNLFGGAGDMHSSRVWARAGKFTQEDKRAMERRARKLLRQNWAAVEALAVALMKKGWILHSEAVAIIEAALAS